jgi:hypothetical protein
MGMRSYAQAGPGSTDRGAPNIDGAKLNEESLSIGWDDRLGVRKLGLKGLSEPV